MEVGWRETAEVQPRLHASLDCLLSAGVGVRLDGDDPAVQVGNLLAARLPTAERYLPGQLPQSFALYYGCRTIHL